MDDASRRKERWAGGILAGLWVFFLLAQLTHSTLPVVTPAEAAGEDDLMVSLRPPGEVARILGSACYDCHSEQTFFPWYARFQPVSGWIAGHVEEGRRHVNFSRFGEYRARRAARVLEECEEAVTGGTMPLPSYTWMHGEARLTEAERAELAAWFRQVREAGEGK